VFGDGENAMCKANDYHIQILEKGMIDCADVDALMGDLVDGDLIPTLEARIREHIDSCEVCSESLRAYSWVINQAKTLKPQLPEDVSRRLRETLNKRLGLNLPVSQSE